MVCIGEDKENILQYRNEELLEERARSLRIRFSNIIDEFDAHVQSSCFNFSIIVLACP